VLFASEDGHFGPGWKAKYFERTSLEEYPRWLAEGEPKPKSFKSSILLTTGIAEKVKGSSP